LAKKQDSLPIWGIVLILVGVFIVTAVIGFLVKKMWDKSVKKKENQKKEAAGDDKNQ
jgi:large-conductance mechanosensitive channel